MKYLLNLVLCFIVFNFIFKFLRNLFNPSNANNNYKRTEAAKTNMNIGKDERQIEKNKSGEYIDYEEIK